MIIEHINPYISIDNIVIDDSKNYVHFITHIDELFTVPDNWRSIIYTSSKIFKFLWLKKNPINQKFFRILQKDETITITLNNGIKFKVIMFEISEITGNLAFHFQGSKKSVVYTGPFTTCRHIMLNDCFRQYVRNTTIDILYLDNTRANCQVETSVCYIGRQLDSILSKHPGYQILLHLPAFGYEELILGLLLQFRFKICVGEEILKLFEKIVLPIQFEMDVKSAEIVLEQESYTAEEIKQRFKEQKRLTVRIVGVNNPVRNFCVEPIGLYQLNWSPHPSLSEMYSLISFIRPRSIEEIYSNMPKLPLSLHYLCLRQEEQQQSQQQEEE